MANPASDLRFFLLCGCLVDGGCGHLHPSSRLVSKTAGMAVYKMVVGR